MCDNRSQFPYAQDDRSLLQKTKSRLFPARHCFLPDAPSEFKDCIHGCATTRLCFLDRLRVLVTGVVVTNWKTVTENEVGRTITSATCHVGMSDDYNAAPRLTPSSGD